MILKTVRVKNFKCIIDTNEFGVDDRVTCLVGKNESGKTAILQALSKLNPVDPDAGDFGLFEYPRRHMMEYQQQTETEPAEALSTVWELSPEDVADLETVVGPAARQIKTVGIDKGYDNQLVFTFEIDETEVVNHLISTFDLGRDDLGAVHGVRTLAELRQTLSELDPRPDRLHQLMTELITNYESDSAHLTVARRLQQRLPKFANFSEYLRMPGQIAVNDLRSRF